MEFLSDKLTNFILRKGIIKDEDYALYHYGLQTGMEMMLCFVLSVILACWLEVLSQAIVVAVVLFALRAYICGIHMKHYISCLLSSTALITVGPFLVGFVPLSKDLAIVGCMVLIMAIHRLAYFTIAYHSDKKEITYFTRQRKRILCVVFCAVVVLAIIDSTGYLGQIFYALTVALASVVLELIRIYINRRRKVDEKEN